MEIKTRREVLESCDDAEEERTGKDKEKLFVGPSLFIAHRALVSEEDRR